MYTCLAVSYAQIKEYRFNDRHRFAYILSIIEGNNKGKGKVVPVL